MNTIENVLIDFHSECLKKLLLKNVYGNLEANKIRLDNSNATQRAEHQKDARCRPFEHQIATLDSFYDEL